MIFADRLDTVFVLVAVGKEPAVQGRRGLEWWPTAPRGWLSLQLYSPMRSRPTRVGLKS